VVSGATGATGSVAGQIAKIKGCRVKASPWVAIALREAPDYQPGLRVDAASNALAGRLAQAQKSVARLRQLYPARRISNLRDVVGALPAVRRPREIRRGFAKGRAARVNAASCGRSYGAFAGDLV
jgi:hypothetical protein